MEGNLHKPGSDSMKKIMTFLVLLIVCAGAAFAGEIAKDSRFIAYDNGTVLDTRTKLMWAARDNGNDINWVDAKFYCENYRGGGYKDWRMPTLDELEELHDELKARPAACFNGRSIHVATELIDITCFYSWTSEVSPTTNESAIFDFGPGIRSAFSSNVTMFSRVLPVRSTSYFHEYLPNDNCASAK